MLSDNDNKELLSELIGAVRTLNNQEAKSFVESLFTKKELSDIASRWASVKLLHRGIPQRKIANLLGISLCKITRGSRELKKESSPFKKFLEKAPSSDSANQSVL